MRKMILENAHLTKTKLPILPILNGRLEERGIAPVSAARRDSLYRHKLAPKLDRIKAEATVEKE